MFVFFEVFPYLKSFMARSCTIEGDFLCNDMFEIVYQEKMCFLNISTSSIGIDVILSSIEMAYILFS